MPAEVHFRGKHHQNSWQLASSESPKLSVSATDSATQSLARLTTVYNYFACLLPSQFATFLGIRRKRFDFGYKCAAIGANHAEVWSLLSNVRSLFDTLAGELGGCT